VFEKKRGAVCLKNMKKMKKKKERGRPNQILPTWEKMTGYKGGELLNQNQQSGRKVLELGVSQPCGEPAHCQSKKRTKKKKPRKGLKKAGVREFQYVRKDLQLEEGKGSKNLKKAKKSHTRKREHSAA